MSLNLYHVSEFQRTTRDKLKSFMFTIVHTSTSVNLFTLILRHFAHKIKAAL